MKRSLSPSSLKRVAKIRHDIQRKTAKWSIIALSTRRSLFYAILFSILCGVLPILAVIFFCIRDGLSDDLLVYCQWCSGRPIAKKWRKKEKKGEKDAGITRAEMRHKCPFISLYSRALLTNIQSHSQPFDTLFIDSLWVPLTGLLFALFAFNSRLAI